jgi:hypothetical protein
MAALATDPAWLGAYIKDPDAAMREAGITDVDQVILKSGQPGTIHAQLSGQRLSFTPPTPMPTAVLVVDMVRPPGAPEACDRGRDAHVELDGGIDLLASRRLLAGHGDVRFSHIRRWQASCQNA